MATRQAAAAINIHNPSNLQNVTPGEEWISLALTAEERQCVYIIIFILYCAADSGKT